MWPVQGAPTALGICPPYNCKVLPSNLLMAFEPNPTIKYSPEALHLEVDVTIPDPIPQPHLDNPPRRPPPRVKVIDDVSGPYRPLQARDACLPKCLHGEDRLTTVQQGACYPQLFQLSNASPPHPAANPDVYHITSTSRPSSPPSPTQPLCSIASPPPRNPSPAIPPPQLPTSLPPLEALLNCD
ncbi:unnamed protein product [Gadus morhua 'NCC']